MNAFAALLDRLERSPRADVRARLLAAYFTQAPRGDRAVAVGLMTGAIRFKFASRQLITELAGERLDPQLYDLSQEMVGDARETVALMWPTTAGANRPPTLTDIAETLVDTPAAGTGDDSNTTHIRTHLARWLDALDANARRVLLTLATGRLSPTVRPTELRDALARMSGRALTDIEAIWHGIAPPYTDLFCWLDGGAARPPSAPHAPFRSLTPVRALTDTDRASLDLATHLVEPLWDGVRVLAVSDGETQRLYTHRGDDISHAFADLCAAMTFEGAIDGVLQLRDPGGALAPKSALRQRINRTSVTKKQRDEQRPLLRAVDVLRRGRDDLQAKSLRDRRTALAEMLAQMTGDMFLTSPQLSAATGGADWASVEALRSAPNAGARGVVLKAWDAPYGADPWLAWSRAPEVRHMALLYVQRATTADALACTVGVWRASADGDELIPIGVVEVHGDARPIITAFARANTVDRFGPVTQVSADADTHLTLTIAFDGLAPAARKKAKAELRAPRLVRIDEDSALDAVSRLEDLTTTG